ncbi:multidrug effflux MFS transporter [Acidisoma sp.]|uniref:multidrug effflux MFS transporter n=1 Tax=Acidisoma sp. TaxID=1872115 RepID=UPI003B00FBF2
MQIDRCSFAFTLLLGLLAAVPACGIDMILPALSATGASLGVPPAKAGLAMSVYLLSLGATPLVFGPVSDRYGRKPLLVLGSAVLVIGGLGCATSHSLPVLLAWRAVQGAGAASLSMSMAIIRDLYEGRVAHQKMSHVIVAINVVPMIAPLAGAQLLAAGGWRLLYVVLTALGFILLLVTSLGFAESATPDPGRRLTPSGMLHDYLRVFRHPLCRGYILISSAAMGAIFAYVAGSSLFLVDVVGLTPFQYGLTFGLTAIAVMSGAWIDGRLSARGSPAGAILAAGLVLLVLASAALLSMTLAGWMPAPLAVLAMIGATFAFGLIAPNVANRAMQPLPQIAGAVGSAAGCAQMLAAAAASGLVSVLFDGHSALSMSAFMLFFAILAAFAYVYLVRPEGRTAMVP